MTTKKFTPKKMTVTLTSEEADILIAALHAYDKETATVNPFKNAKVTHLATKLIIKSFKTAWN